MAGGADRHYGLCLPEAMQKSGTTVLRNGVSCVPLEGGGLIMRQHGTAHAVIEAAAPFRFLSIIHCYDGTESDYIELVSRTPMEAIQAINASKGFLSARGYTLTHTEIPEEVLSANLGGELRRYQDLQGKAQKLRQRLERKRRHCALRIVKFEMKTRKKGAA